MQSEERYLTTSLCRVLPAEDFISAKTKLQKAMNSSQLPEHAVLLVKCKQSTTWYWWLPAEKSTRNLKMLHVNEDGPLTLDIAPAMLALLTN